MPPRCHILHEANYGQLLEYRPNVAVLPWGATEAHNYHLPHGTDVIEAATIAERAGQLAHERGARPIVLPTIPFGHNAHQLDQVATISIGTPTAAAILEDVAHSLGSQGIDRLVVLNGHGGNDFKPLIRDTGPQTGLFILLVNFYQLVPEVLDATFDEPGDHAGEMETSLLLHLRPDLVEPDRAGRGQTMPMKLKCMARPGVWAPRPWSKVHPDTGAGDPSPATEDKGRRYFEAVTGALADVLVELSSATKGDLPV